MGSCHIVVDVANNKAFTFSALISSSAEIRQSGSTAELLLRESTNLTFFEQLFHQLTHKLVIIG